MSPLHIQNNNSNDFTLVSNRFLDIYMPETNGEFIKIYLYLLRYSVGRVLPPSLSTIADTLNCTEKDIERALKYWCKKGLLALSFDDQKHITQITFFDLDNEEVFAPAKTVDASAKETTETKEPLETSERPKPTTNTDAPKSLSSSRVKELKQNEDVKQMLFVAEQFLGKTLTPTDASRFIYFYEELHFSLDLIEYLIDDCISRGSKSSRSIEKTALAWHASGITTVAEAKKETPAYNKNYFTILKALGRGNHIPIDKEKEIMNRWLSEYGFSLEIITEACNRAVLQTGATKFDYPDKILTDWHKASVHTLSDVANLDKIHQEKKPATSKAVNRAKKATRFNNFSQRKYDFDDLEKKLLKKQSQSSKIKE